MANGAADGDQAATGEPGADGEMNGIDGMNGIEGQDQDMTDVQQQPDPSAAAPGAQPERQPNKDRITTPYLTKYERARILGTRALQIR